MFENIRIVLVQTSHPGNIGSTARAMKTMGLQRLVLVNPKHFPHPKANEMASNADDILEQAMVVDSLAQALEGTHLVIGTSARPRGLSIPYLSPADSATRLIAESTSGEVALVFGREHAGLSNEELRQCHYHVTIPANPQYSSLNLAQAVQVLCYELRIKSEGFAEPCASPKQDRVATVDEVRFFYEHLERVLTEVDFLRANNPKRLMPRLMRMFNRIRLEKLEVNILRGILTAIEKHLPKVKP